MESELMLYGHRCPRCYPVIRGMVRIRKNINCLICDTCGYSIDDRKLKVGKVSLEELAHNYLVLIKQLLLNTKIDHVKYTKIKNGDGTKGKKRADRELWNIDLWIKNSKILEFMALLTNMDINCFRERVEKETNSYGKYGWGLIFKKFA